MNNFTLACQLLYDEDSKPPRWWIGKAETPTGWHLVGWYGTVLHLNYPTGFSVFALGDQSILRYTGSRFAAALLAFAEEELHCRAIVAQRYVHQQTRLGGSFAEKTLKSIDQDLALGLRALPAAVRIRIAALPPVIREALGE